MIKFSKNAVIYVRQASATQEQEQKCREYAKENNYKVSKAFYDSGESGGDKQRPGLNAMMRYIASGRNHLSAVIAYDATRLGRSAEDWSKLRTFFRDHKVDVRLVNESRRVSAEDKLVRGMLAVFREYEGV